MCLKSSFFLYLWYVSTLVIYLNTFFIHVPVMVNKLVTLLRSVGSLTVTKCLTTVMLCQMNQNLLNNSVISAHVLCSPFSKNIYVSNIFWKYTWEGTEKFLVQTTLQKKKYSSVWSGFDQTFLEESFLGQYENFSAPSYTHGFFYHAYIDALCNH